MIFLSVAYNSDYNNNRVTIMLDKLDAMIGFQRQALNLRQQRQQILAANIANSDTPNYQARDIDFKTELSKALNHQHINPITLPELQVTNQRHIQINTPAQIHPEALYRIPFQDSADGNTVDMDQERMAFIDNSIQYQGSLTFLGEQFKSLMSVLQQG